jgi:NAD(P)-dependent dehydrogenase (short-subunit alcohol dehydrogenase family)
MQELTGKTAVVTGAASGMGRAFADRFARAGMNVVMSDIEAPRLDDAVAEVSAHGTEVIGEVTDVADAAAVDALAARTFDTFGTAHVVCNNAGVAGNGPGRELDVAEWRWVLDVNLWGVIHGHRAFLPRMIEQGEGHVINTASMAGHLPGHSAYSASKWAVVGITQGLFHNMQAEHTGVGVSCLCPGFVATDINTSQRNRPEWAAPNALEERSAEDELRRKFLDDLIGGGMAPDAVADLVHDAVIDERFWIFTDMNLVRALADKHDSIMENRNPVPPTFLQS